MGDGSANSSLDFPMDSDLVRALRQIPVGAMDEHLSPPRPHHAIIGARLRSIADSGGTNLKSAIIRLRPSSKEIAVRPIGQLVAGNLMEAATITDFPELEPAIGQSVKNLSATRPLHAGKEFKDYLDVRRAGNDLF